MKPLSKATLFSLTPCVAVALAAASLISSAKPSFAQSAQNTRLFVVPHWAQNNAGPNATLTSLTGALLNPRPARFVGTPPYATQFNGQPMGFQYYTGVAGQNNALQVGNPGITNVTGPNATVNYPAVPAAAMPLGNSLIATLTPPGQQTKAWTVKWLYATVAWSGKTKSTIQFDPPSFGAPGEGVSIENWDLTGALPAITETTPQDGTTTYAMDDATPFNSNFDLNFKPTSTPGLYDVFTTGSNDYVTLTDPGADEDILSFPDEVFGTLDYTNYDPTTGVGNGTFDFTALDLSGIFSVNSAGDLTASATDTPGTTFNTPELIVDPLPEVSPLAQVGAGLVLIGAMLMVRARRRRSRGSEAG